MGQVALPRRGRALTLCAMSRIDEMDWETATAAFAWQFDLGATEAIGDAPINRYELEAKASRPVAATPVPMAEEQANPVAEASALAAAAADLGALRAAVAGFSHCELKLGAKTTVFAGGQAGARVMIIGESPGRDEDAAGQPFIGQAGQLLDRMFAAIGLSRDAEDISAAVYITNVMPWRPPRDRAPTPEELAMMKPFLARHIALAQPEVLVVVGNSSAEVVLGERSITKLRGRWATGFGLPVMPICHPGYLLRNPAAKREAWADLLQIKARL